MKINNDTRDKIYREILIRSLYRASKSLRWTKFTTYTQTQESSLTLKHLRRPRFLFLFFSSYTTSNEISCVNCWILVLLFLLDQSLIWNKNIIIIALHEFRYSFLWRVLWSINRFTIVPIDVKVDHYFLFYLQTNYTVDVNGQMSLVS